VDRGVSVQTPNWAEATNQHANSLRMIFGCGWRGSALVNGAWMSVLTIGHHSTPDEVLLDRKAKLFSKYCSRRMLSTIAFIPKGVGCETAETRRNGLLAIARQVS